MKQLKTKLNEPAQIFLNMIILLLFISLQNSFRFIVGITTILLLTTLIIERGNLVKVFAHFKLVLPFIVLIAIPILIAFMTKNSTYDYKLYLSIMLKVISSALILSLVMSKYSVLFMIDGVLALGLPSVLNRVLLLTFRYFFMISEDVKIGNQALTARGLKERNPYKSIKVFGEWIGGFFLKASDHSEKVSNAMKARGYYGESSQVKCVFKDKFIMANSAVLITILITLSIIESRFVFWR